MSRDFYHMSDEEKEKLHAEKLALPLHGQQILDAKKRIKARIKARQNKLITEG